MRRRAPPSEGKEAVSVIALREVSVEAEGRFILKDVSLVLSERRIAIIGANGSGKSTLSRLLNVLLLPGRGEVLVDGVSTLKDARAARAKVGLVFQNPEHQIVMPTVAEDLAFGPKNLGWPKTNIEAEVRRMAAEYGLEHKLESPAHLLSGGEKKLLSILSVLIMGPATIIFDEPLSSLDLLNRRRILALIDSLAQKVVTITHDLDTVAHYDRAILLHEGKVAADGAPGLVGARYLELMEECSPSMHPASRSSIVSEPV
jgi:biotin transport system ATP-binding protein